MAIENKLSSFLDKRTWIIPVLFSVMCLVFLILMVGVGIRRYLVDIGRVPELPTAYSFCIGGELCAIIVAVMMSLSILPAYKRQSGYVRIFFTVLVIGSLCLFFDAMQMMVDSIPSLIVLNKILSIFVFINIVLFLFFFFLYACHALESEGRVMTIIAFIAFILLGIFALLPLVNIFYPLYFSINDAGEYSRSGATWWISQAYTFFIFVMTIFAMIMSKQPIKTKIIISVFVGIPVISIISGGFKFGYYSVVFISMMVSLVLIYAFLFSDNEKTLYSKSKEMGVATNIQQHMLPSIFPAFPDRKEFDIYASMNPAKEVGGDFYDFFLIDDDHLGLVIADVSDKGIPAALFMMASKIMVQNYAVLGQSPKDVIASVNQQICKNNQEEMFVTIWFGILDLKTGILTACNAGHENPVIKSPNGHFEMIKDQHSFIVGWEISMQYSEYQIQLEKGSKIFVYTDGVPESYNGSVRFGNERMLETLNKNEDLSPKEILDNMSKAIEIFVGKQDQFDDTTMLCVEFKGYQDE